MRRILIATASLAVAALAAVGVLALMGRSDLLDRRPLVASVALSPFAVPQGYGLDPVAITDSLVARMQDRIQSDLALRMLLDSEGEAVLRDQAIPRLLNAGVVRRLLEEMEGLGAVIQTGEAHGLAEITLVNRGAEPLSDVAMTMPAPLRMEAIEGDAPEIRAHDGGLASATVGPLAPGETVRLLAWFAEAPATLAASPGWGAGAEGGDGALRLYAAQTGWRGADLQVMPWTRWVATGLLAVLGAGALALGALALVPGAGVRRA